MTTGKLDRRSLMKLGFLGAASGLALEQLGGVPLVGSWISEQLARPYGLNPYDAYAMLGSALRGGPALLGVARAMAASEDGWTLVQIKVCNHVFTPLVFRLGRLDGANVTTAGDVPLASARMTKAQAFMQGAGLDKISDKPRYRDLRFNKWFADILHNGTNDGAAPTAANLIGLSTDDVAELDQDKVAVQAFLGLQQIDSNNHALKGCKMRVTLPDLTLFAQQSGIIESPLGVTCFMMGNVYDKAEGNLSTNAVLGPDGESAIVNSRNVAAYVAQIGQYVGKSYADRAPIEQNTIYRMDMLVQKDPVLRRDLINSIAQFKQGLSTLQSCADLESNRQPVDLTRAAIQNKNKTTVGPSTEFLAQCKYVAASLELPGMPVRNFSLFLNATDLDGADLDTAGDGGGGNGDVQALSYIEAMRQLGMGLNLLGKKIAAGKKLAVIVHSEGGRGSDMGDNLTSFALVLAPKGPGLLTDALYANMATINQDTNAIIKDMAAKAAQMPWDTPGLVEAGGTAAAADVVPTTGDVQMGLVEFLEGQSGKTARSGLSGADGRYVKLKRA